MEKSCRVQIENMLQQQYNHAIQEMNTASTFNEYNQVKERFEELGNYKDSEKMALKCQDMITALQKEEQIKFEAQLKRKRLILRLTLITFLVGSLGIVIALLINAKILKPRGYYKQAEELIGTGNALSAVEYFEKAGKYKDAEERIAEIYYKQAEELLESGNVTAAKMYFYRTGNYKDAKERADILSVNANNIAAVCDGNGAKSIIGIKEDGRIIKLGGKGLKLKNWKNIITISAGYGYFVSLKVDGRVMATGENADDQCKVEDWKDIKEISIGGYHTVGLRMDGTVVATGRNADGRCDVEDWKDIMEASAGGFHTVGLEKDGTVVATGQNLAGQCNVEEWEDIMEVSAGGFHTAGLKMDGTVVATGRNADGQCDVAGWKDIVGISAGGYHTVGLKSDGTVVATGWNEDGQCDVQKWKNIVQVYAFENCTLGVKSNGTVVATGNNKNGILSKVRKWTGIKVK